MGGGVKFSRLSTTLFGVRVDHDDTVGVGVGEGVGVGFGSKNPHAVIAVDRARVTRRIVATCLIFMLQSPERPAPSIHMRLQRCG